MPSLRRSSDEPGRLERFEVVGDAAWCKLQGRGEAARSGWRIEQAQDPRPLRPDKSAQRGGRRTGDSPEGPPRARDRIEQCVEVSGAVMKADDGPPVDQHWVEREPGCQTVLRLVSEIIWKTQPLVLDRDTRMKVTGQVGRRAVRDCGAHALDLALKNRAAADPQSFDCTPRAKERVRNVPQPARRTLVQRGPVGARARALVDPAQEAVGIRFHQALECVSNAERAGSGATAQGLHVAVGASETRTCKRRRRLADLPERNERLDITATELRANLMLQSARRTQPDVWLKRVEREHRQRREWRDADADTRPVELVDRDKIVLPHVAHTTSVVDRQDHGSHGPLARGSWQRARVDQSVAMNGQAALRSRAVGEEIADRGHTTTDRVVAEVAETEYQLWRVIAGGESVTGHGAHPDSPLAGRARDGDLVGAVGQPRHGVKARRQTGQLDAGDVLGERGDQG